MKKLFLITSLLFCSISYGQVSYEDVKEKLTHIRCDTIGQSTSYKNGKDAIDNRTLDGNRRYFFAFDDSHFYSMPPDSGANFMLIGWKERDVSVWSYNAVFEKTRIEMGNSRITYTLDVEFDEIGRNANVVYKGQTMEAAIDRVSGNFESEQRTRIESTDGSNVWILVVVRDRGKCSPYNPDQRAF